MSEPFNVRVEWLDAPGVATPELAATWARYEVWVGSACATQVETADGTLRRSIYGSLYPLAEWIVSNWWALKTGLRPSSVDSSYWTWMNLPAQGWLRSHNFRGAGDGMSWPNLTLVPEGAVTRVRWFADGATTRALRFVGSGDSWISSDAAAKGLAALVENTLERLSESGLPRTRLAEDWRELGLIDDDGVDFCVAAARLGLDPLSLDDKMADEIVEVAGGLPDELVADFFDNAEPVALGRAAEWMKGATRAATRASTKAHSELKELGVPGSVSAGSAASDVEPAWARGYEMARRARQALDVSDAQAFDVSPWLPLGTVNKDSAGIVGVGIVDNDRCGLVLGGGLEKRGRARKFAQARALGRALARPDQRCFLLSAARGYDERVARAFAAELLAPASGISEYLAKIGRQADFAFEAVADHYGVSPLLVRHQYENQLAGCSSG